MKLLRTPLRPLTVLALMAGVLAGHNAAADEPRAIVGWKEKVRIPALDLTLASKNDTGAESASLHAENIEKFEKDGEDWVRFDVVISEDEEEKAEFEQETIRYEAPIQDTVLIKQKGEESNERYMIKLDLCMAHLHRTVEVNLADRSGFSTRMLLGREFLSGAALVDSSAEFTTDPKCIGPAVDAVDD
ncbi:ATP-dependent zinc protease family protein [Rhodovibrio salinarum]|uniref:Retropepsin-like aspartic endopeptidase domain-containing protein n=1 Tax=Rhodovibrio salinarum TaxID=1087 RepID=A0A934QFF0_9PROT|nr:RimK/LysX family protein [Rhodovibrio salinarum]MBK1695914.1 hypothetical protein [Rhodovibrio salinarum]